MARLNCLAHTAIDRLPVGAAKHRTRAEQRKRIILGSSIVNGDIPEHVITNLLREVDIDAKEVRCKVVNTALLRIPRTHDQLEQPQLLARGFGTSQTKGRLGKSRKILPYASYRDGRFADDTIYVSGSRRRG